MKKVLLVLLAGSFAAVNAVVVPKPDGSSAAVRALLIKNCEKNTPYEDNSGPGYETIYQFKMKEGQECSLGALSDKIERCLVQTGFSRYSTENKIIQAGVNENVTARSKGTTVGVCFDKQTDRCRPQQFVWRMTVS